MDASQNVHRRVIGRLFALIPGVEGLPDEPTLPRSGAEAGDGDRGPGNDRQANDPSSDPGAGQIVTPRERVMTLLAHNGGRMKQGDLVSAVDWSESTVSRKLCELEDTEAIVRYRIGREKIVFLPGEEPASFRSPLDRDDEPPRLTA